MRKKFYHELKKNENSDQAVARSKSGTCFSRAYRSGRNIVAFWSKQFFILFTYCIKNQLSLRNKANALMWKFIIIWQNSVSSARLIFTLDSLKLLFENIFYMNRFRPCFRMMKGKRWRRRKFFNIFFCINNFSWQFFRFRWFSMTEKWARSRECWGGLTEIFLYHTLLNR